ncbi:ABC transporter ATP-binding protein [Bifidobacterium sp.]|jgi:ABC-type dipeptide/oligopeptide/nickel transport system ATPase component|uniref:ABC transporter ATP-binding protein n=1 Tax=Bifidobacterium sp. TaxID=41200 RepID=UPI0025C043F2|nr:ABC transporter ATP-binding protein [Bifidobacterium sp.]MCI1635991.1 ABC transporter ATP-binding protein [Bifidobacterium sp.]
MSTNTKVGEPHQTSLFADQGKPVGISIRDLSLELHGTTLLNHVSIDIEPGRINGLAGESGSGKTLTGMSIMGLPPEDAKLSGSIVYGDGVDLLSLKEKQLNTYRGRRISMVFQDPTSSLHPMLSIERQLTDGIRHHLHLNAHESKERALELLKLVKIPDPQAALERYPHEFSGGQLQRIAIALALSCDSRVLIADEPTTALDVTVQAGILHLLKDLNQRFGLTIVLITHDLGVMSALADTIAVMRHGEIVEVASRYDIIRHPQHPYTVSLIESLPTRVESTLEDTAETGGIEAISTNPAALDEGGER